MQYGHGSTPTTYEVPHAQGAMCRAAGLTVQPYGHWSHVICSTPRDHETFWATRYAFLRANPNAD